jgi:TATA-box binding protein (TBP) (component of TFIID and TFIIIB)
MADNQSNVETLEKRKPGRPRKHDPKVTQKDTPIGLNFDKTIVTTKTFAAKVDNFDPLIKDWYEMINQSTENKAGTVVEKYLKRDRSISVFKNCFHVVLLDMNLKKTTVKVCKNGAFHLTGCKSLEACEYCIVSLITGLWSNNTLKKTIPSVLKMSIKPVMTNVKFTIGFQISIEKSLDFFNNGTIIAQKEINGRTIEIRNKIHNFLAYRLTRSPALNIKKVLEHETLKQVPITKITFLGQDGSNPCLGDRKTETVSVFDDIASLNKEGRDKFTKTRYTTFLLFRSGMVILSGMHEAVMKDVFEEFQTVSLLYQRKIS